MNEQRVQELERRVSRLTSVVVGMAGIGVGAVLMGATGAGSLPAEPNCWCGPQPAGAPKDGFVVVPEADGYYTIIRPSATTGTTTRVAQWRFMPRQPGEEAALRARATELEQRLEVVVKQENQGAQGEWSERRREIVMEITRIANRLEELEHMPEDDQ